MTPPPRRAFLVASSGLAAGLLAAACRQSSASDNRTAPGTATATPRESKNTPPVTATEDLMREHGVLRRALLVYREVATRLRANAASVPLDAVQRTALLFRTFGEDYHETRIEEGQVFPGLRQSNGPAAAVVDTLIAQHRRGRELTAYLLAVTQAPKVGAKADELARVLDEFARMYEAHAAREDTVVFPMWKLTMSKSQYEEAGDKFEDIEQQQFGKDGFEDAVQQMNAIEARLGLTDLAALTAPPPPKS